MSRCLRGCLVLGIVSGWLSVAAFAAERAGEEASGDVLLLPLEHGLLPPGAASAPTGDEQGMAEIALPLDQLVCGCDGNTYINVFFADEAGVGVDHNGPCTSDTSAIVGEDGGIVVGESLIGGDGGGRVVLRNNKVDMVFIQEDQANSQQAGCTRNRDCTGRSYCAKAVGDCDGVGECRTRPRLCPLLLQPVCGCDGNTYENACLAASRGVSVAHYGCCEGDPCPFPLANGD